MPSEKRQRQREGRVARQEAIRAARRRRQQRRRIILLVVVIAVVAVPFLIASSRDEDGEQTRASGRTTTTTKAEATADPAVATRVAEYFKQPKADNCPNPDGSSPRTTTFAAPPGRCIEEKAHYEATVSTDVGDFVIALRQDKAPQTANNFVFLSRFHAYDSVPFHRVIPGFVVQGGDVEKGDGTGGPGYKFADELPKAGEYKIGSLAMANSGPNTNGSQFFVITGDQGVQLPPNYSFFGTVISGTSVVEKIEADGSPEGVPKVVHKIEKVTVKET